MFWGQMFFEMYGLLILNLVLGLRQQICLVLVLNSVGHSIFGAIGMDIMDIGDSLKTLS